MATNPTVSIVVVNYNGGLLLAQCIQSIRKASHRYEIIVIDNNSTDESLDALKLGDDLRLMRLPSNFGFARASNVGIKASLGSYVVLLNSDTTVMPSWLDRLVATVEQSPETGIVTPKMLRPGKPAILDSTGHLYEYRTGFCEDRGSGEVDRGQYDGLTELVSCSFACVLIKRQVFQRIGLLDEKMFFYYEDIDFSLRARIAGIRILYSPHSVVYHLRGGSTPSAQGRKMLAQSQGYPARIFLKNYEIKNAILYSGRWVFLAFLRVIAGIKNRDTKYVKFYANPILWNLLNFPIKERVANQRARKLSDRDAFRTS